ncbi:hypothetical protein BN8_03663 [Fibrisoma limi BUZ 3]|uniref:Tape measure protein N-terminal domain-containing protein n=2 Tax=Fibrisoma limi TaxID=663275 RepID=I2GKR2_9BACT|nr:hypothetical protein BN8_03663 [Fibrisoma limi BUZ 3]
MIVTDYVASFKQATTVTSQFVNTFKQQFDGLKRTADAPKGAFSDLTRTLSATGRQIKDILATGGQVPDELSRKYALLRGNVEAVNRAFNPAPTLSGFQQLNQRLSETRAKMQELLVAGKPVPAELSAEYRKLESQINQVNGAFAATPSRMDRIVESGNRLSSVGRNLSILTAGLALVGATAFKDYADIDGLVRGLRITTGSVQNANKEFAELRELSKLPGLGLQEVSQGVLQLEALGFAGREAQRDVREVGNAIALGGKGKVEFGSVITQFTQLAGKSKVLAEDLKPIVNASPVIAKAIQNIFGTVDSEQISGKLQAVGKGPRDFINLLVDELSKVERVSGGPKNAMENFGDSVKIAGFEIGKAADNAFNLTGLIDGLGNGLTGVATRFGQLPTGIQQATLTVAGLTAATGPLLLGIGSVMRILPLLKTGFLAASGPIGLTVAAVAGAAVLIIANWDSIKKVLVDSGIWSAVSDLVDTAMATISDTIKLAVDFGKALWATFGSQFISIGKFAFEGVANLLKFTAGVLQGTLKVLTGLLTGDWRKFAEGFQNIGASLWNAVINSFTSGQRIVGNLFADFLSFIGADSLSKTVRGQVDSITGRINGLKVALENTKKAAASPVATNNPSATGAKPTATTPTTSGPKIDFKNLSLGNDSEFQQAKKRLKELKDEINSLEVSGKKVPQSLRDEYTQLAAKVKSATDSTKLSTNPVRSLAESALSTNERILQRLTRQLKEAGDSASDELKRQVAVFQKLVEDDKKRVNNPLQNIGPGIDLSAIRKQTQEEIRASNEDNFRLKPRGENVLFNEVIDLAGRQTRMFDALQNRVAGISEFYKKTQEAIQKGAQDTAEITKGARILLAEAGANILTGIGESIGRGQNPLKIALKSVLDLVGGYLIQLGTALLFSSAALLAAAPVTFGITLTQGIGQKIAGAGLIVGGGLVKGLAAKPFAKGGLIAGPTLALMGEYSGAVNRPEFVSPVDIGADLISKRIINNLKIDAVNSQSNQIRPATELVFPDYLPAQEIQGDTLLTWYERADRKQRRTKA